MRQNILVPFKTNETSDDVTFVKPFFIFTWRHWISVLRSGSHFSCRDDGVHRYVRAQHDLSYNYCTKTIDSQNGETFKAVRSVSNLYTRTWIRNTAKAYPNRSLVQFSLWYRFLIGEVGLTIPVFHRNTYLHTHTYLHTRIYWGLANFSCELITC